MLRNKSLTVLQKTYDDSYLSCSTAVYHESQGNEAEAMRHWKSALEQIYDHNANKQPYAYSPRGDTEKALVEALKQLELQCKERIDLLEALRLSRTEEKPNLPIANGKLSKAVEVTDGPTSGSSKGSIGLGTIPAVTYSELSRPRPPLPTRPSLPMRTSSEAAVVGSGSVGTGLNLAVPSPSSPAPRPPSPSAISATEGDKKRTPSPEKHSMRMTLRSGRPGDTPSRSSRKSKPAAEGPSKAASLAWGALSGRERQHSTPKPNLGSAAAAAASSPRSSSDQSRKHSQNNMLWDYHSRRLVPPRDTDEGVGSGEASASRHSDELPYSRPSFLSVTAASSALNSSSSNVELNIADGGSGRSERSPAMRSAPIIPPSSKGNKVNYRQATSLPNENEELTRRRSTSDSSAQVTTKEVRLRGTASPREQERPNRSRRRAPPAPRHASSTSDSEGGELAGLTKKPRSKRLEVEPLKGTTDNGTQLSEESLGDLTEDEMITWKKKKKRILSSLPPGVDKDAAKQILNDIVVQGDEVRWTDVAGLEIAKNALREAVVYPFLRPDLFMGLREPTRGMLLFGPPGTGKTMLARAVATESKSTFFSISASSLTSKFLGESEKLVRALFGLAKVLAPSIIFVDEIDSLLSQRSGSGEHEATRRIKTEFLIQWSDLQRAAAGRETTERDKERGDANRVLVLAATNLPWAIDEAARRRFVRRQYIPLPEPATRETQLRTLLGQQKHSLGESDIARLVDLTDGFSGSDITALAKDAAMGPLRSLGEALLHMTMEDIRPIMLVDFEASLKTIRPSVSKVGLKEYENWAKEFGERGG